MDGGSAANAGRKSRPTAMDGGSAANAGRSSRPGGHDPLAALGALLACPACGDAAGLARRTDHFACGACKARFPVYKSGAAQVPWLFRDPEAARLEWRARFNGFLHANAVECSRHEAALRDRRLTKLSAERIRRVLDARAALARRAPRRPALGQERRAARRAAAATGPHELLQQRVPRLELGEWGKR